MRLIAHITWLTLSVLLLVGVFAQDEPQGPPKEGRSNQQERQRPEGAPARPEAKKDEMKPFDEVTKDTEKLEGLFTLYRKRNDLYLEIQPEQLGKLYFVQATLSTGLSEGLVAGNPVDDLIVKFEKVNEQIQIVLPNYRYRSETGGPLDRSVRRSFSDSVLGIYKIESIHPERKSVLINVGPIFLADPMRIGSRLGQALTGNYSADKDKSYYDAVRVFPLNVVFQVQYYFNNPNPSSGGSGGGSRSRVLMDPRIVPLKVVFNLFELPVNNGYVPRLYDPRVGYFTANYQDLAKDKSDDQNVRYILRWHLEKQDPTAPISPPKQPIVFWLDNAIPEEYRPALKEGLLLWNKAFEKVGIKDAIEVHQMPDDADWDHADMRYNVIRWVTSPASGYAVAQFRENPLTGQIFNASITFDANMARFANVEYEQTIENVQAAQALVPHPERYCSYAQEKRAEGWLGMMAMDLLLPEKVSDRESYTKQYLREVAAHEMGHIMGLRHNFIASVMLSLEEANDQNLTAERGVVASVMDYNPVNIAPPGVQQGDYYTTTLGPYDYWAIEYGYTFTGASKPEGEVAILKRIASYNTRPEYAYATDEDTGYDLDPRVNRFDLGKDMLRYTTHRMELSKRLWARAETVYPEQGESYGQFRRIFNRLFNSYSQSAVLATRYVGGVYVSRNFRGDPNERPPMVPVEGAKQKEALQILRRYVLDEGALKFSPATLQKLGIDYNRTGEGPGRPDFSLIASVSAIQQMVLLRLFNPSVLARIQENELRATSPAQTLTLPELFRETKAAIWSEVPAGRNVSLMRRQLQRGHLRILVDFALDTESPLNGDARVLAMKQLRALKTEIEATLQSKKVTLDDYTRAHLEDVHVRIRQVLTAQVNLNKVEVAAPAAPAGRGPREGGQ